MRYRRLWKVVADVVTNLTCLAVLAVDGLVVYALCVEGRDEESPKMRAIAVTMVLGYAIIVQLGLCLFGCGVGYVRSTQGAKLASRILWAHLRALVVLIAAMVVIALIYSIVESFQ